ncbi:MAG TPA: hypothetical protein VKB88_05325, partial [Bryobacteraceae bacterium]|nr:hypothetical protein [Bryobacteraceae bacterium]
PRPVGPGLQRVYPVRTRVPLLRPQRSEGFSEQARKGGRNPGHHDPREQPDAGAAQPSSETGRHNSHGGVFNLINGNAPAHDILLAREAPATSLR